MTELSFLGKLLFESQWSFELNTDIDMLTCLNDNANRLLSINNVCQLIISINLAFLFGRLAEIN